MVRVRNDSIDQKCISVVVIYIYLYTTLNTQIFTTEVLINNTKNTSGNLWLLYF